MKTILILLGCICTLPVFAQKGDMPTIVEKEINLPKKIDVTVRVNGYTVRIRGNVHINPFTRQVRMECFLTLAGANQSESIPVVYTGALQKGPMKNEYHLPPDISENDALIAETIISRLEFTRRGEAIFVAD